MAVPSPSEIRAIRQDLGLSASGFATALGYDGQARLVRAMEEGERNGEPFVIAGAAAMALRYLRAIAGALRHYDTGVPADECMEKLRASLPEELR